VQMLKNGNNCFSGLPFFTFVELMSNHL